MGVTSADYGRKGGDIAYGLEDQSYFATKRVWIWSPCAHGGRGRLGLMTLFGYGMAWLRYKACIGMAFIGCGILPGLGMAFSIVRNVGWY